MNFLVRNQMHPGDQPCEGAKLRLFESKTEGTRVSNWLVEINSLPELEKFVKEHKRVTIMSGGMFKGCDMELVIE